jgi:hypothetical protein
MRKSHFALLFITIVAMGSTRLALAYPLIDSNITIAAPTINLTTAQVASGYSGYFDVTLTDSVSEHIAQFQVTLALGGDGSQVALVGADLGQITNAEYNDPSNPSYQDNGGSLPITPDGIGDAVGASPNLIYPYILGNVYSTINSGDVINGGVVSLSDANDVSNSDGANSGTVTLTAGVTYSLMQVYFTVAPGFDGGFYPLTFDTNVPYNNTAGQSNNDAAANFVNLISNSNTTSYEETKAVFGRIGLPEPGSVVMMALGAIGLAGFSRLRGRRQ